MYVNIQKTYRRFEMENWYHGQWYLIEYHHRSELPHRFRVVPGWNREQMIKSYSFRASETDHMIGDMLELFGLTSVAISENIVWMYLASIRT